MPPWMIAIVHSVGTQIGEIPFHECAHVRVIHAFYNDPRAFVTGLIDVLCTRLRHIEQQGDRIFLRLLRNFCERQSFESRVGQKSRYIKLRLEGRRRCFGAVKLKVDTLFITDLNAFRKLS